MSLFRFSAPTQTSNLKSLIYIGSTTNFETARLSLAATSPGWSLSTLQSFLTKSPSGLTELISKNEQISMVNENGILLRVLPFKNSVSRHMARLRIDLITKLAKETTLSVKDGSIHVSILVENKEEAYLAGLAVCKNWPVYNRKKDAACVSVTCDFILLDGSALSEPFIEEMQRVAGAIRETQRLMDTPPEQMRVSNMIQEARDVVARLHDPFVSMEIIQGQDLKTKGFGGIFGVGKGASDPPALVVLSYKPKQAVKTIALVGKGIIYDTGGLSIKGTASMCEMKFDKGGACAILNAFGALVQSKSKHSIHAVLCLAENAVGPDSFRNDDILNMYSGLQVEINNTDAEGRLVLGDGVAYAAKHLNPDVILDMATLTGAQLITTGVKHCAILTPSESLEAKLITAGKQSGDLCFPLLYAPQLLLKEFDSKVADMKNSVKDRSNAQCSCAGHFIEAHLDAIEYKGEWVHVDIAGPAESESRGTGFGVALIYELLKLL